MGIVPDKVLVSITEPARVIYRWRFYSPEPGKGHILELTVGPVALIFVSAHEVVAVR